MATGKIVTRHYAGDSGLGDRIDWVSDYRCGLVT